MAREYAALLVHFSHLAVADVTRDVARQATELRARHHLRPVDASQLATALVLGATAFVGNDACPGRLPPVMDGLLLDDPG